VVVAAVGAVRCARKNCSARGALIFHVEVLERLHSRGIEEHTCHRAGFRRTERQLRGSVCAVQDQRPRDRLTGSKIKVERHRGGRDFPEDPFEQLRMGVNAVFSSWHGARAVTYRRLYNIPASSDPPLTPNPSPCRERVAVGRVRGNLKVQETSQ
jgi:hypothetical protein